MPRGRGWRVEGPGYAAAGGEYAARAGVEGPLAQGIRAGDLRQARYAGLAKTRLQHLLTAAAMNFARLGAWFAGRPRAATRPSRLAALAA
jgi:hypothetical protein